VCLKGKGVCEFVGRCGGGRHWAVGTEDGFWEAGIIRDEGDGNLPGERKGAGGEVAFTTNALSDEDWSMSCLETWLEKEQTMIENLLLCELLFLMEGEDL